MKKIVIAVDSFKGSLSPGEACEAIAIGINDVLEGCKIVKLSLSDGGEGLLSTIGPLINAREREILVDDPIGRIIRAKYLIDKDTAIIEMALASGLTLLDKDERNPMITNTFGLGQMILDGAEEGCRQFVIGIGGSATNDAGTGMLMALGFRFSDRNGDIIEHADGAMLCRVYDIDSSAVNDSILRSRFTVACDVNNPFYGPQGAAHVYAPQKGATKEMVEQLDMGLHNFACVIDKTKGITLQNIPGSGAAGGVGGAMVALLGAKLKPGIELVLKTLNFESEITDADLVITGEGKIDSQTTHGKVPMGVLNVCKRHKIRVIALAGAVQDEDVVAKMGFEAVCAISPLEMPLEEAMRPEVARRNLRKITAQVLTTMKI